MEQRRFEVESSQLFSKSKIWQLNRDFYEFRGLSAFSDDVVPHHLTSNSLVGKTYAELIFGLLSDLSNKGKTDEVVYILELGAGHGRLAFHILKHLQALTDTTNLELPPYTYILSDIVEENLLFFEAHPQFEAYFKKGILDVSYFDAVESNSLFLRHSNRSIDPQELAQPIVAIANYFFDSIPNDLFLIKDKKIAACNVSLSSNNNPESLNPEELINNLELTFRHQVAASNFYKNSVSNELLAAYSDVISNSYLFFPEIALNCLDRIKNLSTTGLFLLSIDKGFHEIHDLENKLEPEIIKHGSFSIWVNFHALGAFCEKLGGTALFPSSSTFHLELAALLFLPDSKTYHHTHNAYQNFVDDFGPDDFNTLKHFSYAKLSVLSVQELIAFLRLSHYDSTYFNMMLPRLKQVIKAVTFNERQRILETLQQVWNMYFSIGESFDLSYEIGGLLYELGFYAEALDFFKHSILLCGEKADTYYNMTLSYYQLRRDKDFYTTLKKAKAAFPDFESFKQLDKLDMA